MYGAADAQTNEYLLTICPLVAKLTHHILAWKEKQIIPELFSGLIKRVPGINYALLYLKHLLLQQPQINYQQIYHFSVISFPVAITAQCRMRHVLPLSSKPQSFYRVMESVLSTPGRVYFHAAVNHKQLQEFSCIYIPYYSGLH